MATGLARIRTGVGTTDLAAFAQDLLTRAGAYSRDRMIRRDFAVAGLHIEGWFTDQTFADICSASLVADVSRAARPLPRIRVNVISAQAAGWGPPPFWGEPEFSPARFERTMSQGGLRGYHNLDAHFWQFFDPRIGEGIQFSSTADGYPPWESGAPLRAFLHWSFNGLGRRFAHAATLGIDGRGVLLAGAGGSGKSGTTLTGILNGLASVGDDYVLVDESDPPVAFPVFAMMKQDPVGLARLGGECADLAKTAVNWQGKIPVDPRRLRPNSLAERLTLRAVLFPGVTHADTTTISPISAAEAMRRLAPSSLFQMPGDTDTGFRFFADLVRKIPAYGVSLSRSPADVAAAIRKFISAAELPS